MCHLLLLSLQENGGHTPCIHFYSLHYLAEGMPSAFHCSESWVERSPVPKRGLVGVSCCLQRSVRWHVFAAPEDARDTLIMIALWDNSMHESTSCSGSTGRSSGESNAGTCHGEKPGLAGRVGNIFGFLQDCEGLIAQSQTQDRCWQLRDSLFPLVSAIQVKGKVNVFLSLCKQKLLCYYGKYNSSWSFWHYTGFWVILIFLLLYIPWNPRLQWKYKQGLCTNTLVKTILDNSCVSRAGYRL